MHAVFLAAWLFLSAGEAAPIVAEDVDTIAVCHIADGGELIYFFGFVQGEWAYLDSYFRTPDMTAGRDAERFTLSWYADGDSCHRVVRAKVWLESWEAVSHKAAENNKPWHARLCAPGLKRPK